MRRMYLRARRTRTNSTAGGAAGSGVRRKGRSSCTHRGYDTRLVEDEHECSMVLKSHHTRAQDSAVLKALLPTSRLRADELISLSAWSPRLDRGSSSRNKRNGQICPQKPRSMSRWILRQLRPQRVRRPCLMATTPPVACTAHPASTTPRHCTQCRPALVGDFRVTSSTQRERQGGSMSNHSVLRSASGASGM